MSVTVLTYEKVKTRGSLKFYKIDKVELDITANEHGKMVLTGFAKLEETNELSGRYLNTSFCLYREQDPNNPIFSGLIERIESMPIRGLRYLKIEVVSATKLLDTVRKKRSFQNVGMTYADIARKIMGEYPKGFAICTVGEGKAIGKPLIQYDETDWEFLKRIASHEQGVIVPECTQAMPRIWFGFPERSQTVPSDVTSYRRGYCTDYRKMVGGYSQHDFLYLEYESYADYQLGFFTKFQNTGYLLYEKHGKMENGELVFRYRFGQRGFGVTQTVYNEHISGMSLLGEVAKNDGQNVYIKLDIDQGGGGEYGYPWRPETGNLMYCMPQVGTRISLYFPNGDERAAIAVNCIRTNGASCDRMSDPTKRSFATEHGKELTMYPDVMGISSIAGVLNLDDAGGIQINSEKKLVVAGASIFMEAPKIFVQAPQGEIQIIKVTPDYSSVLSSFLLCHEFDLYTKSYGQLIGHEFTSYEPFDDAPEEANFWASLFMNILAGLAAVAVVVVVIAVTVGTGGIGGAMMIGAGAVGCIAIAGQVRADLESGTVSSMEQYMFVGGAGAVSGAMIASPVGVVSAVGQETSLGFAKRLLTGEETTVEAILTDAKSGMIGAGIGRGLKSVAGWFGKKFSQKGLEKAANLWWMNGDEVVEQGLQVFKPSLKGLPKATGVLGGLPGSIPPRLVERLRQALPSGARPEVVVMLLPKLMMEKCPQLVVGTAQRVMVGQAREILEEAFDQGPKAFAGNGSGSKPPEPPESPTHNADDKNQNGKESQPIPEEPRTGKYTDKIKWGIHEIEVRPEGKGFWGKRIKQKNPQVDKYELKINPQNESYYLLHPDGSYVQFENMVNDVVQDGKLIMQQKSFYHINDMPDFAKNKVLHEAQRQLEAANAASYKVEWLVSDENAVSQLAEFFTEKNMDIIITYYPE